jgi:hypothetical protein
VVLGDHREFFKRQQLFVLQAVCGLHGLPRRTKLPAATALFDLSTTMATLPPLFR